MKPHVQLLGLLQLAWGGMGLLLASSLLLLGGGAAAIARSPGGEPASRHLRAVLVPAAARSRSAAGERLGRTRHPPAPAAGRRRPRPVRRELFAAFGTALAIYTFWVLLHNEARALFIDHAPTAH
jgi:hypothetical protein